MSEKTALVVDDSKSARFALRKYLENLGYKVDAVEGANEAYTFLQSRRPQVIFLDHVMPGIDGFEALAHIKGNPQTTSVPVVICSSNDGADFCADARTRGAHDILCKPPSTERLSQILDHLSTAAAAAPAAAAVNEVELASFDLAVEPPPAPAPVAAAPVPPPAAPKPAPAPVAAAPQPNKVSVIREPEVAIEQAVMKALRGAMQQQPAPAAPVSITPVPPPAEFNPNATGSFNLSQTRPDAQRAGVDPAVLNALREQMESRFKKLNQDMFLQIAELKAAVANVDGRDPGVSIESVQQMGDSISSDLRQRISALESSLHSRLSDLAQTLELRLAEQSERLNQVAQAARTAAAQEAEAVAERTMLSAATRIAEQLAAPLLKARNQS